uniref:Uncharacterized protein n=1 Tax=Candidatus Kentrum sp. MB TaxID=2138164 RepID=A0A450XV65_9GAMM|nr:MAG: hypothetical protein BECKMB1821G_GA0114241_105710 [Candidatus Kentron sp. MB]VFK33166.1 MAG: hypothetical protein BECKMB1821I_GA0114274_104110 [Candidatus Kentron sp. MB]VFK76031.1 MAG: hypothetical protein BECKMB1821H_GA0114242_103910 [Candidatus Kentron sp. MB]
MTAESDLIVTDFSVFPESAVTIPESTVILPEYLRIEKTKILGNRRSCKDPPRLGSGAKR